MPVPDPDGQVSLMVCESILHILVEEGRSRTRRRSKPLMGSSNSTRENDDIGQRRSASRSAAQLIEAIAQTFALRAVFV